jgi:predicted permease
LVIQSSTQLITQFGLFYLLILAGYLVARFSEKGRTLNVNLAGLLVKLLIPLLTIYSVLTTPPEAFLQLPTVIILTLLVYLLGPAHQPTSRRRKTPILLLMPHLDSSNNLNARAK